MMRDGHMKPKELWQNNNGHVLKTNLTAESEMCSLAWQLCSSLRTKDVGRNPSEGCNTPIPRKSFSDIQSRPAFDQSAGRRL